MPSVLTPKYRAFLAEQFLTGLTNGTIDAYVFLGRPQEWVDSANVVVSDINPPTPTIDAQSVDFEYWRDMIGAKRVGAANTQIVVARRDWTVDTVYDQYDDTDVSLFTSEFYVLDISDVPYRVYKCLWNNGGAESTVAPSTIGDAVNPVTLSDGYVWQYLYSIEEGNYKFLTTNWMPVLLNQAVVDNAVAYAGRLPTAVPLIITSGGTGYNAAATTTTTVSGDGQGANVTSNSVSFSAGILETAVLANGGIGYTKVTSISVTQNGVSNTAAVRAIIPPYPNHGAEPITELGAGAVMLTITFNDDEGGALTVNNDFRRSGLLINPRNAAANAATLDFYRQTYDITFSANTGVFHPDDVIVNSTKTPAPSAIVVDVVAGPNTNYIVRLTNVNVAGASVPFDTDDTLHCAETGAEVTVESVSSPELAPYSGSVVYVNQRTPVLRANGQAQEIKIVFPFG